MDGSKPRKLTHVCPHCGLSDVQPVFLGSNGGQTLHHSHTSTHDCKQQIIALEQEVDLLAGKAAAQADKLEDAELEIERLRNMATSSRPESPSPRPSQDATPKPPRKMSIARKPVPKPALPKKVESSDNVRSQSARETTPPRPSTAPGKDQPLTGSPTALTPPPVPAQPAQASTIQNSLRRATSLRFGSFLRKTSTDATAPPVPVDPHAALQSEHALRVAAEAKLLQVNTELEDLSATLFQQANEMVAAERKMRAEEQERYQEREKTWEERGHVQEKRIARLEERVKTLEERDKERAKRLEMLERGMRRVGRVRGLVANGRG